MSSDAESVKNALAPIIEDIISKHVKDMESRLQTQVQNILIEVAEIKTQQVALQALYSGSKKTIKVKKEAKTDSVEPESAAAIIAAEEQKKPAAKKAGSFKLPYPWFTHQYKNNEDFRKRYTTADMTAKYTEDAKYKAKKSDVQKLQAAAQLVWSYLKDTKELYGEFNKEYEDAKAESLGAENNEEETEPVTPK